jgi:hypothetical protein
MKTTISPMIDRPSITAEDLAYAMGVVTRDTDDTQQSVLWALRSAVCHLRLMGKLSGASGLAILGAARDGIGEGSIES